MARDLLESGQSILVLGKPGVGKTTLARIYSQEIGASFFELSAVSAGMGLTFRRFVVDYSLEISSSQLGIPHLISLRMTLP